MIINSNMLRVEENAKTNVSMPQIKYDNRLKVILTRLGQVSCRFQRLGMVEEQYQSSTHLNVLNVCHCLYLAMWFQIAVKVEEYQSQHGEINYEGLL